MDTIGIIALGVACVSLVLSGVAYWRSGGRRDIEAMHAELRRRVRSGYEASLARIQRAEERLAALRASASVETTKAIEGVRAQLAESRAEIEARLGQLEHGLSVRADAAEQSLERKVLRLEGRAQLLLARTDAARAERLAAAGDFAGAHDSLEEAVARVREVRLRLTNPFEQDPAFQNVVDALLEAIRSVRAQAADHERRIERVLSASDSLVASLAAREETIA